MGCDIHVYTEKFETVNGEKKWRHVDYLTKNNYYNPDVSLEENEGERPYTIKEFYRGRNYELFGLLSEGVRTEMEHALPVKGIPEDVSQEVKEEYEYWDCDGHSHNYVTYAELKELQKSLSGKVIRKGMLAPEQVEDLRKGIKPDHWCGWTSREDATYHEWEDDSDTMDDFMEQLDTFLKSRFYNFELQGIDDNLRVVYWFDN